MNKLDTRRIGEAWRASGLGRNYSTFKALCMPLAQIAHSKVQMAVERGELRRVTDCKCVDCGRKAQQYDHRDYRKPLAVDPVCRSCNLARGHGKPYGKGWKVDPNDFKRKREARAK